jgi:hypothetical protein
MANTLENLKQMFIGDKIGSYILARVDAQFAQFINTETGRAWNFVKYPLFQNIEDDVCAFLKVQDLPILSPNDTIVSQKDIQAKINEANFAGVRKVEKPRFIDFVRYVRPYKTTDDYRNPVQIDNLQGITFKVQLDYEKKTIRFGYSVCNGDNFNKKLGIQNATSMFNLDPITMPMYNGKISQEGTIQDIYNTVAFKKLSYQARKQMKDYFNYISS